MRCQIGAFIFKKVGSIQNFERNIFTLLNLKLFNRVKVSDVFEKNMEKNRVNPNFDFVYSY
ncbi:MAG: hypothetical protein COX89_00750 [Candidatus Nealsonbacteria bacterium CG_4_10_14_0_2_um_filter_37_10]|uniref:Uncharacterized protein n=3 Tax=Candidatus Nealsoniibacteriota TaxID=1817911 RepID=A0A2M7V037_9BACT|nr:MAG: hypothetical protein COU43_01065 [Candidatus Nealsonbacteria bacterium CG10_big_fil_rev_8_21_14_0_10_37_25]PIZ89583.1 MAG: hypothetical protein COX89_00750 [Candidatus Nealsonbacteria bacterium CG_4_10_14_0_2_um_filter_37_10]PJA84574.1 MAG: hypothetical protein CO145_00980 [Candidatus Nealsonbacteria bacterium CG_4_9_14_3_um_filter_37_13]